MEKEYSPWYWHNKALREHPEYQIEGMIDCFREEQSYYLPYLKETTEVQERIIEPQWSRKQWDYVTQIRNEQIYLRKRLYELLNKVENNEKC